MADIKKIKVGATTYDIRDATAARSNHTHTPSEAGAAAAHHLYHTWDNNTNYYDSFGGDNMFRIVTENMYADCFRFQASTVSNLEYYNGSSWASWNFDLSNLFDGNARTGVSIPYANRKFRFQLTANGGWPTTGLFMLQGTWFDDGGWPNGQKSSIIIETRASTSDAWSQKASFDLSGVEGMAGHTLSSLHTGNTLYRITIEIAPWTKTSNKCPLQRLCLFSNYNGGALETLSYTGTGNITTSKSISAGSFIENGKSLTDKYLGKTAKAADADKLDGNDSAYYLNYNNLSNKPTIPTVPTALKNPNSITFKAGSDTVLSYDGSAAKTFTVAASTTNGAFTISDGTTTKTVQLAGKFTDNNTTYSAGTGLQLSGTTFSAKLNSTTSLGTIGSTSKLYAVGVDANDKLCVNVPWTDTDTHTAVDSQLSSSSTNPLQNKAIYSAFSSAVGYDLSYYFYGARGSWRLGQYNTTGNTLDIKYGVIDINSQSASYGVSFSGKNFTSTDYTVVFGLYRFNAQSWFWSPIVQRKNESGFQVFIRGNSSGDNSGTLMYLAIRSN